MHRHVVEQQELLQMSKQAEMRKDKRNKELDFNELSNLDMVEASRKLVYSLKYYFEASTWDAMIFLGLGSLNQADSVLTP